MRIKNKKTGQETVVTPDGWAAIVAQGWQKKYAIINESEEVAPKVEVIAIPKSISADLKEKSTDFDLTEIESKLAIMTSDKAREDFVMNDPRTRKINNLMKKYRNPNN